MHLLLSILCINILNGSVICPSIYNEVHVQTQTTTYNQNNLLSLCKASSTENTHTVSLCSYICYGCQNLCIELNSPKESSFIQVFIVVVQQYWGIVHWRESKHWNIFLLKSKQKLYRPYNKLQNVWPEIFFCINNLIGASFGMLRNSNYCNTLVVWTLN